MIVKLLTEHHLQFLSFKEGCTVSSESTHVKMPYCWKSHVAAHLSAIGKAVVTFLWILVTQLVLLVEGSHLNFLCLQAMP